MKRTYETGMEGEARAEEYLRKQYGMICLEHRHRNRAGEIDLILEDHGTIVFAEVKPVSPVRQATDCFPSTRPSRSA